VKAKLFHVVRVVRMVDKCFYQTLIYPTSYFKPMKEVLNVISPGLEEKRNFTTVTTEFLKKINSKLKNATAIIGGSGAKGTWLSGNHDVDIFVLYDLKTYGPKTHELSKMLKPAVKKAFPKAKIETLHGSRDYFQLIYNGIVFEIVPILKISKAEQALNITDVSPLHAKWVKRHVKDKNEVLLAKQFFKANKLYGAESYIAGFSGYILEILVMKYGTFNKLLKAAVKWKDQTVIDVSEFYKGKDVLFELNQSKLTSPLVVIDPVDKSRNACAALGINKFLLLKKVAAQYLKNPNKAYFAKEEIVQEVLKKEASRKKWHLVMFDVTPVQGKEDVVGLKLLKVFTHIKRKLDDFNVKKADWDWVPGENATFYFMVKEDMLDDEVRKGPPTTLKEHVKHFKKQHSNTFTKNGHVMAKVKRNHPKLANFVKNLLKDAYVKERIIKIT
jgi:tRNA nucleotidyltransferase (CCA-adding enzyme)